MKIELCNITKAFDEKVLLKDFSCTFEQGSITAVMGPSGCGKTTLLQMMAGLEKPDAGDIIKTPQDQVAITFQEDRLVTQISAVTNLQLVCDLSRQSLEKQLLEFGIDLPAARLPAGKLSGGQARRVALLRALLAKSGLLLLDEPFAGLDKENRGLMCEKILKLRQGRTLVFVTHDKTDAAALNAQILQLA